MSRSRNQRNDYGEKWAVAVTLMDKPCDIEEVQEHFKVIGRRYGLFDIDAVLEKQNMTFERWIKVTLDNMLSLGWVTFDGELYDLTDIGRREADKVYTEWEQSAKLMKKALSATMVSTVTFITHLFLALIKLPAALLSGSVGLMSDALDTLVDALSSLLMWFGIRKNKEEAANAILVILMLITGGFTTYKAVERIFNPVLPEVDSFTFIATIVSAILCGVLYIYQRYTGVKTKTPALITQSVDSRNHVFAAISVTAGLVAALLDFVWLDIVVGLVVAILIMKSAVELLIELIKRAGGEETDSYGKFAFYANFKSREYRRWMLGTIAEHDFASEEELIAYVKTQLDTRGNRTLMAFDKDVFTEMDSTVAQCLASLIEDECIVIGDTIELTEKGVILLASKQKPLSDGLSRFLKGLGLAIWYVVEFIALYLGIRYLSGLIGAKMLWVNHVYPLHVGGMTLIIGNLVATSVGLIMYVYGRYRFAVVCRAHRHKHSDGLMTTGLYKAARHPMYGAMAIMQIGVLSGLCYRWAAIFSVLWFGMMIFNAVSEEKPLLETYGDAYRDYMKATPDRLMPKWQMVLMVLVLLHNVAGVLGVY